MEGMLEGDSGCPKEATWFPKRPFCTTDNCGHLLHRPSVLSGLLDWDGETPGTEVTLRMGLSSAVSCSLGECDGVLETAHLWQLCWVV